MADISGERELLQDAGPVTSGLPALDYILRGGYAANRVHLIEGEPGAGRARRPSETRFDDGASPRRG